MTDTGWFSRKQYNVIGSIVYEGEDGLEVHVTEVTETGLPPKDSGWDDFVCKGKLERFLRTGDRDHLPMVLRNNEPFPMTHPDLDEPLPGS